MNVGAVGWDPIPLVFAECFGLVCGWCRLVWFVGEGGRAVPHMKDSFMGNRPHFRSRALSICAGPRQPLATAAAPDFCFSVFGLCVLVFAQPRQPALNGAEASLGWAMRRAAFSSRIQLLVCIGMGGFPFALYSPKQGRGVKPQNPEKMVGHPFHPKWASDHFKTDPIYVCAAFWMVGKCQNLKLQGQFGMLASNKGFQHTHTPTHPHTHTHTHTPSLL